MGNKVCCSKSNNPNSISSYQNDLNTTSIVPLSAFKNNSNKKWNELLEQNMIQILSLVNYKKNKKLWVKDHYNTLNIDILCQSLHINHSLHELYLGKNKIIDENLMKILNNLSSSITKLSLINNRPLSNSLYKLTQLNNLKYLDLSSCQIHDEIFYNSFLLHWPEQLNILNINNNLISNKSIEYLALLIQKHPNQLHVLSISNNVFDIEIATKFYQIILTIEPQQLQLTELIALNTSFTFEMMNKIRYKLQKNFEEEEEEEVENKNQIEAKNSSFATYNAAEATGAAIFTTEIAKDAAIDTAKIAEDIGVDAIEAVQYCCKYCGCCSRYRCKCSRCCSRYRCKYSRYCSRCYY